MEATGMLSNVRHMTQHSDTSRILAAAEEIRGADCVDSADLAALLATIGEALRTVGRPPMAEAEMWRWSAVVHQARRISAVWVPR